MNAVISALCGAVGNNKKHKVTLNKIRDALKAVEADELPRSEILERGVHLADVISESVMSLHKTRPQPTLAFCAAVVRWLFKTKLEPTLERGDEEDAKAWEDAIFRGLMQPILSIIDSEDQDLAVVGNVIYKEICGIMRSPWSQNFGGRFAHSLVLVLVCTYSSPSNKAMLLDPSIFGIDTLSKLIIDAKDYHHLDNLLELSFNMFSSQGGKVTRKTYADSIFGSGYASGRLPDDISNELASIHSVTNGGNSEKHVLDIMRTMSRASIERPQVFMTKDLSYCGTRFTQTPPSNVIILDHKNLCIVFCDRNGENDVLAVATTTIKSVELIRQDASRIIVELAVAEPPLISSSREELATPDSHIPGSPPRIRFSIASSDIFGLEAALAARDLAGVIKDDNALTPCTSSAKISNAVFSVPLKKNRNTSNEQADEMIREYVNLPSSRGASPPSPPPAECNRPTTRTVQSKFQPPEAPVTPTTTARPVASPRAAKLRNVPPFAPGPVDKPASRLPVPAPAPTHTIPVKPAGSATTRTKRSAAEKSQKAIKLAALADLDGSELTDVDPKTPSEHSGRQTTVETPAEDVPALPTPPRTRARTHSTKLVAKTLVPATPNRDDTPQVSSPPDVPSPSPKPAKKRKLVEDDPFELPPLKQERPTKQRKTEASNVPSNSQHILPRNTAATRVKAKYGTISKRMRASSPVEPIHSADTEEEDPPQRKAPATTKGKKGECARVKNKTTTETQPRLKKNDKPDAPKRQNRARAAKVKAQPIIETDDAAQNKVSKLSAASATGAGAAETSELPKKRGRPPKNKPTQQPVKALEPPNVIVDSIEQASSQPEPRDHSTTNEAESTRITERDKAKSAPATIAPETTIVTQEEAPEDDDLLRRLSQAAKKALRSPIVDNQPIASPYRSPSPAKTLEIEMECPEVDVATVEPPVRDVETRSAEGVFYQPRDTTPKPMESSNVHPTVESPSAHPEDGSKSTNSNIEVLPQLLDVPVESAFKSQNRPSATLTSTKLQVAEDIPSHSAVGANSMDNIDTNKPTTVSTRLTRNVANRATHQQDPKPTPVVAHIKALALTPQEHKSASSLKLLDQHQPARITERIQVEKTQVTEAHTPVRQVETPPAKDVRRTKFPPVLVSVDLADSDVEMETSRERASHQANVEPIRRPSVLKSRITPTTRPVVKPQPHPAPVPAKVKHAAVTRILFDNGTQPSPKSALASPQRRTLANGTRPSVSFLDPPAPISRRGSSGSSTEGPLNQQTYGIDREKLRGGHSAHTGDVIIQIADIMTEIQETIALNLGEKIEIVNAEARSARAELTKGLMEELDMMKAESEFHHKVLHKFETAFASQAQAMLKGLARVVERNDRMNTGIESILTANARAGQGIAGKNLDFQVPELFGALLTS